MGKRLWELRHTCDDAVEPKHKFWYARNKKTGNTVSAWKLSQFTDRAWLKSKGLPAYLAKFAADDDRRWWDQLHRTGKAPGFNEKEFLGSIEALKKTFRRS